MSIDRAVVTTVVIDVRLTCVDCGDKIVRKETLDAHALHTGNYTQRAAYWHEQMTGFVLAVAAREGWTMVAMAEGAPKPQCGVCTSRALRKQREP